MATKKKLRIRKPKKKASKKSHVPQKRKLPVKPATNIIRKPSKSKASKSKKTQVPRKPKTVSRKPSRKKSVDKKRSKAAKRGWETRRGIAWKRDNAALKRRIRALEKQVEKRQKEHEEKTEIILKRYRHHIAFDGLPPRMIQETAEEHAIRIVKMMNHYGFTAEQSYSQVAAHTGLSPREVYTMFCYVGPGEIAI